MVYGHFPEKRPHFVFPKTFLCCRVRSVIGLGLSLGLMLAEISLNTLLVKDPFGQVYNRLASSFLQQVMKRNKIANRMYTAYDWFCLRD